MTDKLLTAIKLGDLQLHNRIVHAPMTRTRAQADNTPTALMAKYYAQRASAGLLIAEATAVAANAIAWLNMPGAYKEAHVAGWKKVTDAVHAEGGTIFLQIWHPGRATHSSLNHGSQPVAPSAVRLEGDEIHTKTGKQPYETPRELNLAEITTIVGQFKQAAKYAKAANFDGIEIHAANGYLIDQFLQSKTNQRNDAYGGSTEKRYTFLKEVITAVLDVFPSSRVGVRLAPNGVFDNMGSPDYRQQFSYVASQLDSFELAYLHVMDGLAFGFHELGEPMTLSEFRQVYNGLLIGNCGYTRQTAESALTAGDADMIAFGRPYITNPDLAERFANNTELAEDADPASWYGSASAEGYTNYTVTAAS